MAMKQTQTKLFDFSDVGLDFCAGSKNLFPDRFKKMLSLGYNEQTVSSVSISGNQVTLNYGVSHSYVADRVLKIKTGALAEINNGEFWIDSVTTNTVTMTIDDAPTNIEGNFKTVVAPLGWELVYELNHIHIYKFKHIDDTDMYARFCFQNATTAGNRNCIAVGVGRTIDLAVGHITDSNTYGDLGTCETVVASTANLKWDFTSSTASTFNSYTYLQGVATFGQGRIIGSLYHFALCYFVSSTAGSNAYTSGILPWAAFDYPELNYPVLLCASNGASTVGANSPQLQAGRMYAGSIRLKSHNSSSYIFGYNEASSNFISSDLENFNTTACTPILLLEQTTGQVLGALNHVYQARYANSELGQSMSVFPRIGYDIDLIEPHLMHVMQYSNSAYAYLVFPIEEIKLV